MKIPGMIRRVLNVLLGKRRDERRAKRVDLPGKDVFMLLLWLLLGVVLTWSVYSFFGNENSADALLPVMFAILLVMIGQAVSWQRDGERRKHERHMEGLLVEIRNELKRTNGHLTRIEPSFRRTSRRRNTYRR